MATKTTATTSTAAKTTPKKKATARYARRAALAGLAVTAVVAVGLLVTPAATAPDTPHVQARSTPGRLTKTSAPSWINTAVTARVTVDGARIRTRPAPDGIILGLIPSGAILSVRCTDLGRGGDLWGEAAYQGINGWVHASLWQPSQPGQQVPRCGTR